MHVSELPCSHCGAVAGERCRQRNGREIAGYHQHRHKELPKGDRPVPRHTWSMKLKMAQTVADRLQRELDETKEELRESKVEVRRLRRILHGVDVGQVLELKQKLADAEAYIKRLKQSFLR